MNMLSKELLSKSDFHHLDLDQIQKILETDVTVGLSDSSVDERLTIFGLNILKRRNTKTSVDILLKQFKSPLVFILSVSLIVSAIFFGGLDTLVILLALILNLLIGFYQEKKADGIFKALSEELEEEATVLRNSQIVNINTEKLVPGDIILLEAGKKIPADARLFESQELKCSEAVLTGEWEAVEKDTSTVPADEELSSRKNMVYAGTLVLDGLGRAIVTSTGANTEFGNISTSISEVEETQTPLQIKVNFLSKIISGAIIFIIVFVAVLGVFRAMPLKELAMLVIALAVAAVPEGLPAAIAVALAVGMERILKNGGLVKYPVAAETLGSVDFILTDKTGTLTNGRMSLSDFRPLACLKKQCSPDTSQDAYEILKAAVLASDAYIEIKSEEEQIHGRPIEKAIIQAGLKFGIRQDRMFEEGYNREDFVPFSSARRFAISLNRNKLNHMVYLTGAPETLVDVSEFVLLDGETVKFTKQMKEDMRALQEKLSSQGYKLTATARIKADAISPELKQANPKSKLPSTFLGFMVFEDSVRDSVPSAIDNVHKMGVEVLMVTGDHQGTALSVAKKSKLADSAQQVIIGKEFEKLTDEQIMDKILQKSTPIKIFARMLPRHKKRLASLLQARGLVVAMTGDGINDAPALAVADIGIAVESGTDVAKAAADMILLKSSFKSIVFAVKEGRKVLTNIFKIIVYLLSTAIGETVLIGTALAFGGPLPLLPSQLLWHNIVEGGLMNFPFAFDSEIKKSGVLAKDKKDLERKNYIFIALLSAVFSGVLLIIYWYMLYINMPITQLRTVLFVTFSTTGFMLAFSLRNVYKPIWRTNIFGNKFLNLAILVNMTLLILVFLFPVSREFLGIDIPIKIALYIILLASIFKWMWIEIFKYLVFQQKSDTN